MGGYLATCNATYLEIATLVPVNPDAPTMIKSFGFESISPPR